MLPEDAADSLPAAPGGSPQLMWRVDLERDRVTGGGATLDTPPGLATTPWSTFEEQLRGRLSTVPNEHIGWFIRDVPYCVADLATSDSSGNAHSPADLVAHWRAACRVVAVVRELVSERAERGDAFAAYRQPLVARTLFLLLSLPFRFDDHELAGHRVLVFGSAAEYDWRAQRAQEDWYRYLRDHRQHRVFDRFNERELELEYALLVGHDKALAIGENADQSLRASRLNMTDERTAGFLEVVTREALLARYQLWTTLRLSLSLASPTVRVVFVIASLCFIASAAMAPFWAAIGAATTLTIMLVLGLVGFLGVSIVALAGRPLLLYPLALRLPAASVIGASALAIDLDRVALLANWAATGVVAAAALGYLVVEAANHGVPRPWPALRRAAVVAVVGLVQAIPVAAGVTLFARCGRPDSCASVRAWDVAQLVLFVAVIGLAVGVFLQLLWEDKPVTYPLGRMRARE